MSQVKQAQNVDNKNQFLNSMEQCGERAEYHNLVDILFVIDATGSMSWCISQMKKTVCKIMKKFSDKQYNIKFAIELYRDHPPQEYSYVEKHFDLRNQDDIIKVIDEECDVAGGGDTPQAAFDGLVNGLKKTKWRISSDGKTKSKRFLFHGCDAPPHGKQYGSTSTDKTWTQKGCPCGFTRHDVKKLLDEYNVDYSLIKCGTQVDIMAGLFKQCFAQRFKRELQIKNQSYSYRGGIKAKGLKRKLSVQYMEQIQRQEGLQCQCQQDDSNSQSLDERAVVYQSAMCQQKSAPLNLCVDEIDKPLKKQSFFDSIKQFFGSSSKSSKLASSKTKIQAKTCSSPMPTFVERQKHIKAEECKDKPKKVKRVKKVKQQEKEQNCQNSSDQQKGGKPRSMASLVLSDIQDGIDSYFDQPQKQKKQKPKVTKDI